MLRRDRRYVVEREELSRAGKIRLAVAFGLAALSLYGITAGASKLIGHLNEDLPERAIVHLEEEGASWKSRPENPGGRRFLNTGLAVNGVQSELFDVPTADEVRLAPPPDDF